MKIKLPYPIKTHIKIFIVIFIVGFIFVYLLSWMLDPDAFLQNWKNHFYLFGAALLGVAGFGSSIFTILLELIKDERNNRINEGILKRETCHAQEGLKPDLAGLKNVVQRDETNTVLSLLNQNNAILLTGEGGTGKSGIGVSLVDASKKTCVLLDVRRFDEDYRFDQFAAHLGINENIYEVISRLSKKNGCLVIIDQLDTMCNSAQGTYIVEFAVECTKLDGVSVVVISRHSEIESQLLRPLLAGNFVELKCKELQDEVVIKILNDHGMAEPSEKIINLGKNILLLNLICTILIEKDPQTVEVLNNDIDIWIKFFQIYLDRENKNTKISKKEILQSLMNLAKKGLSSENRSFILEDPPTILEERFASHGLITKINTSGQRYIFRIEKLQDYLYARNAAHRQLNKKQVRDEINSSYLRNIFYLMLELYRRDDHKLYESFFDEVLSG
jgi:hypothetical protein